MTQPPVNILISKSVNAPGAALGRRRAGRVAVNPALIPLLRGASSFSQPARDTRDHDRLLAESLFTENDFAEDAGSPARGILLGLLLSLPLWGLIVAAIYWIIG